MQPNTPCLDAHYYDGRSSRRQPVRLSVDDAHLLLDSPEGVRRSIPAAAVRASEAQGSAPRTLRFVNDNAFCEVGQGPELDALLTALCHRDSIAVRLQNRWRWALASLASIALILLAAYFWGLPWGAKFIAPHVPVTAMRSLSDETLAQLDKYLFKPSALPEDRRRKLQDDFQKFAAADPGLAPYGDRLVLSFRASPAIGPNAFALPGGQIVLLDELVALYDDDAEILAILGHELGHLSKRHGIRMLIQSSAVAVISAAWLGDISYAVGAVSGALLSSGYSRDMEREADDYAAERLRQRGESPALLASALEKLEAAHHHLRRAQKDRDKDGGGGGEKYLDWLSSHPNTGERIRQLRENP
ncbi:MAG: M48 family metallopeptidase [Azoarcus sp.]|jgi:Zn-dependent protease with chaperone function|nr:M48 family metallopeptidase [Azoarcus sp.]